MTHFISLLNKFAHHAMKQNEMVIAVVVVAVIFMLILPMPTQLVDSLIAVNICISTLLIVLVTYMPGPLAFSTFPGMLLITTLFRLALSISTTRLILLEQDAGDIVETFGNFVAGGNLAVGLVIFLIITVAQFLVIAKGSERVAEVAARFTLDAMPGKQMSIDSDLRAGLIDAREARQMRMDLSKESSLFGALDGAMKFVKGDAIAGLVIVAVNLIGGLCVGVLQYDMSAGEAMQLYSILTIGDGLIAQIPALLISLTAGIIITRVSSGGGEAGENNIGVEMATQLLDQPRAWLIASVCMTGFALVPGMPTLTFLMIALVTGCIGGYRIFTINYQALQAAQSIEGDHDGDIDGKQDLRRFTPSKAYLIQLHRIWEEDHLSLTLIESIRKRRNHIVHSYGITLPSLDIEYTENIAEDEIVFSIYEVPRVRATLNRERAAIMKSKLTIMSDDFRLGERIREEEHLVWVTAEQCQDMGLSESSVWLSTSMIVSRLEHIFFMTGAEFIGLQETRAIMSFIEQDQPELGQELQRTIPLAQFAAILRKLASERMSLRSIRQISETLIEYAQYEKDIDVLSDYVRVALKAQLCFQYAPEGVMKARLLSPKLEEILRDSVRHSNNSSFFVLAPEVANALRTELKCLYPMHASNDAVLLVAQDLRRMFRTLIEEHFHHVPVLSFAELTPATELEVIEYIDIEVNTSIENETLNEEGIEGQSN
ncbi:MULTISPECIES: type III secretion system export apparatus subunit SctV [Vibrio]|uniref:type III secretion system export apparatus subunit SctV n=1 Tax=Vibrio TaxID=662 RepID=UPI0001B953E4|nr:MULTISPECIES: type III secretion system export apparatus subunit SctV [Vibrio]EEX34245.1 Type III secretion inner membrane channel protein [Vibrio coralliilyticus ATCC BAA-450]MDE3898655.1 type III secretion system export apparatus subunit SctV [Vibrio sp. CC007]